MEIFIEARKYVKYALSAIDYEDKKTAVENLQKAIGLLGNKWSCKIWIMFFKKLIKKVI